ncbi:MAG TPA: YetF domain-containing protein [Streptomyces sp.]|nr:YetF domain-containing protein [Streptomyces sp.]
MWHDLMSVGISYGEKAVRTVLVYLVILVLLRWGGKRELAQLNTFDLVVMLLLANVVQNAIIGPDNSVAGAAFAAAVLLVVNALVVRAASLSSRLGRLLEGSPVVLARDGHWLPSAVRRSGLSRADLDVAVKRQGGDDVSEATTVSLEPGGSLLVSLREGDQAADKNDVAALRAEIAALRQQLAHPRPGSGPGSGSGTGSGAGP